MRLTVTHVLEWVPGYLAVPPRPGGWWDLMTIDEYKSGKPPERNPDSLDWPRDTGSTGPGFLALHRWVAERLGWHVTLEEGTVTMWRPWPPRLPSREPVYYVHAVVWS